LVVAPPINWSASNFASNFDCLQLFFLLFCVLFVGFDFLALQTLSGASNFEKAPTARKKVRNVAQRAQRHGHNTQHAQHTTTSQHAQRTTTHHAHQHACCMPHATCRTCRMSERMPHATYNMTHASHMPGHMPEHMPRAQNTCLMSHAARRSCAPRIG
jgi:hypothetical protein